MITYLKTIKKENYFLPITFSVAFTIAALFSPYLSMSCAGVPDSPKVSLVAINSCGVGLCFAKTRDTLSPNPPKKLTPLPPDFQPSNYSVVCGKGNENYNAIGESRVGETKRS